MPLHPSKGNAAESRFQPPTWTTPEMIFPTPQRRLHKPGKRAAGQARLQACSAARGSFRQLCQCSRCPLLLASAPFGRFRSRFAVSERQSRREARAPGMHPFPAALSVRRPSCARSRARQNIPNTPHSARRSGNTSPGTFPFARALHLWHLLVTCSLHTSHSRSTCCP